MNRVLIQGMGAGLLIGALLVGLAFWLAPGPGGAVTGVALANGRLIEAQRAASALGDSLRRARAADSARADTVRQQAVRLSEIAKLRNSAISAYRDTVRVLNDSVARVVAPSGEVHEVAIDPAIAARIRADSAALEAQTARADGWERAEGATRKELATARLEIAARDSVTKTLTARIPLERALGYAAGRSRGRKEGALAVIGAAGAAAGTVYLGIRIAGAFR